MWLMALIVILAEPLDIVRSVGHQACGDRSREFVRLGCAESGRQLLTLIPRPVHAHQRRL